MKAVLTGPWGEKTNVEIIKSFWKKGAELRTIRFENGRTADVHLDWLRQPNGKRVPSEPKPQEPSEQQEQQEQQEQEPCPVMKQHPQLTGP